MSHVTDRIETAVRERPVLAFVCCTFAVTWGVWWPVAFGLVEAGPVERIGGFAPTIVGLVLTAVLTGKQGLRALGHRLVDWRAGLGWYLLALAFTPVLLLLAVGGYQVLGGRLTLPIPDPPILVIGFVYVLVTSVAGEEIGWRGFALPRLQRSHSALTASVALGAVWFLWPLPLFYMESDFHRFVPLELFALQILGFSVLYTWLFNNTDGSLLFPHLFHTANNFSFFVIPVLPMSPTDPTGPLWIGIGVLWVIVVGVVLVAGPRDLSRESARVTCESS